MPAFPLSEGGGGRGGGGKVVCVVYTQPTRPRGRTPGREAAKATRQAGRPPHLTLGKVIPSSYVICPLWQMAPRHALSFRYTAPSPAE